ncbi:MAG: shikimate dehydrogenase [Candidatus Omnitrophica bacterium]|nr:shikimate dehydrogenase [Candidatus Omnitrophota bacterium]
MEEEEQQAVYGIIGKPVSHSLSPVMHNAAFKALDVNAVYKLFPLEKNEIADFFSALREPDSPIFGLNVTVPYKEDVVEHIDVLTPLAEKLGAVNTIVINHDRKLIGYNTDAPGFIAQLKEMGVSTAGKRIAILGSGGSCRAILGTLCMIPERPELITIYNRTESRLTTLLKDLGQRIDLSNVEPVRAVDDLNIELADILINTTSIGLKEEDPILVDEEMLHSSLVVYDLIYRPKETMLLKMARERGAQTANGLNMLYFQGVLSLQHWANIELSDEIKSKMRKALEKELSNDRK